MDSGGSYHPWKRQRKRPAGDPGTLDVRTEDEVERGSLVFAGALSSTVTIFLLLLLLSFSEREMTAVGNDDIDTFFFFFQLYLRCIFISSPLYLSIFICSSINQCVDFNAYQSILSIHLFFCTIYVPLISLISAYLSISVDLGACLPVTCHFYLPNCLSIVHVTFCLLSVSISPCMYLSLSLCHLSLSLSVCLYIFPVTVCYLCLSVHL